MLGHAVWIHSGQEKPISFFFLACVCTPLEGGEAEAVAILGLVKPAGNAVTEVGQNASIHVLDALSPLRRGRGAALLQPGKGQAELTRKGLVWAPFS